MTNEHWKTGYKDGYQLGFQTGLAPNGGGIGKPPEGGIGFPDIKDDQAAGDYRIGFRTGFADGYADGLFAGGNE